MAKKSAFGVRLIVTEPTDLTKFRLHYVGDISGPSIEVTAIDATNHDSPDGFAAFLPGMADGGDVTFDLFFDPSGTDHARLIEICGAKLATSFALLLPKPSARDFVVNPFFEDGGENWSLGIGGGFSVTSGAAVYTSSNPPASDFVVCDVALTPLETYQVEVTFSGSSTNTGPIEVIFDGAVIGTVDPYLGGTQIVRFEVPHGVDTAEIGLQVPSSISAATSFTVSEFRVVGIGNNDSERFEFFGLVTKVGTLLPVKDAMKAAVTIKVSGAPQYVSGVV